MPFAYIFAPVIGYVSWQLASATLTGFIAKENVVGTLAVCFGISNLISAENLAIQEGANVTDIATAFGSGSGGAMLTEEEAKAIAASDPTIHATNGRPPSHTLEKAFTVNKPKAIADAEQRLRGMGK